MTWFDDLRRVTLPDGRKLIGASFRGVPFFVDSEEYSGGRRVIIHEFPLRDDPFGEDLGRLARTFRVDGYVIGDDYLTQRDALISKLEDEDGTGELVLPGYGVKRAMCPRFSVRTSRTDGGMATFAIDFAETPAQVPAPVEVIDAPEQVDASADLALAATDAELVEQYDATGLPAFALESAKAALVAASEALESGLAGVITATQELAALAGQVELLTAQAASLVRQPAAILGAFRSAITILVETVEAAPGAVMSALVDAYAVDLGAPVVATTSTRARELANQTALVGALRRVLAIEAARLAPVVPYESIEQATAARDQLAAIIEEQAGGASDTAYPALVDLRSQVLRAVPGAEALASVITVSRSYPIPSLVLAYQTYGSVDREADIIARNGIAHPGFVAGELKVLSDG